LPISGDVSGDDGRGGVSIGLSRMTVYRCCPSLILRMTASLRLPVIGL
jgi:hypothetical protein